MIKNWCFSLFVFLVALTASCMLMQNVYAEQSSVESGDNTKQDTSADTFRKHLEKGQPGDFGVFSYLKNYIVIFLKENSKEICVFDEIVVPKAGIPASVCWKKWVADKAPGHTSWTTYKVDLKNHIVAPCYSQTNGSWINLDVPPLLVQAFLDLPMNPSEIGGKLIGPEPVDGEVDTRRIWTPSLTVEGKKDHAPQFSVYNVVWMKDQTLLSQAKITLYFNQKEKTFPFPYWIEVDSAHFTFRTHAIDSGHGMLKP